MTAVNSFPFINEATPEAAVEAPVVESAIDAAKHQLSSLSVAEGKEILRQLFAAELIELGEIEKENGFKAGLEQAKKELTAEHRKQKAGFRAEHEAKLKELEIAFAQFSKQDLKIELNHEDDLVFVVMQTVLHLIGVQLEDKDYIHRLIKRLAKEYALSRQLTLTLSPGDLESAKNSILPSKFQLIADEILSAGDYRLELDHGSEVFCLRSGLTQLVDAFSGVSEEKNER